MTIDEATNQKNPKPRRSTRTAVQNQSYQSDFLSHMVDSDAASYNSNNLNSSSASEPEIASEILNKPLEDHVENVPPEIPPGIKKFKFIQPPPAPIFYPTEEEWFGQSPFDYINSMQTCSKYEIIQR